MGMRHGRGFTLVEVLVALVIVALGMGALMATLTMSADSVGRLRDRTFAEWIALNRIAELRLRTSAPPTGESSGVVEYAGTQWRWKQTVETTALANLLRIDVTVSRPAAGTEEPPALATVTGFYGSSLNPGTGEDPDWSGFVLQNSVQGAGAGPQPSDQGQTGDRAGSPPSSPDGNADEAVPR